MCAFLVSFLTYLLDAIHLKGLRFSYICQIHNKGMLLITSHHNSQLIDPNQITTSQSLTGPTHLLTRESSTQTIFSVNFHPLVYWNWCWDTDQTAALWPTPLRLPHRLKPILIPFRSPVHTSSEHWAYFYALAAVLKCRDCERTRGWRILEWLKSQLAYNVRRRDDKWLTVRPPMKIGRVSELLQQCRDNTHTLPHNWRLFVNKPNIVDHCA